MFAATDDPAEVPSAELCIKRLSWRVKEASGNFSIRRGWKDPVWEAVCPLLANKSLEVRESCFRDPLFVLTWHNMLEMKSLIYWACFFFFLMSRVKEIKVHGEKLRRSFLQIAKLKLYTEFRKRRRFNQHKTPTRPLRFLNVLLLKCI